MFLAGFIINKIKKLDEVNLIVEKAQRLLENENMFDKDYVGAFWGIIETRPYMRARFEKMSLLYDLERNTEAIKECEDMLRLCESDNLGVRLILVSLYVLLEKFDEAEKLIKKYGVFSLEMKISLAIMFFKKGEYKLSKKCIREIDEHNPFLACLLTNEIEPYDVEYYARGSEEEAIATLENMHELIFASPMFASFMLETLGIKLENEEY